MAVLYIGCSDNSNRCEVSDAQQQYLDCYHQYGNCETSLKLLVDSGGDFNKYLQALWMYREENYGEASTSFKALYPFFESITWDDAHKQEYTLTRIKTQYSLNDFDLTLVNLALKEIENVSAASKLRSELLIAKSNILRDLGQSNYALSIGLFLQSLPAFDNRIRNEILALNGIHRIREMDYMLGLQYFKTIDSLYLIEDPFKLRVKVMLTIFDPDQSNNEKVHNLKRVKNHGFYAPGLDRFISTNLRWIDEGTMAEAQEYCFEKCHLSFWDMIYHVEFLLDNEKTQEANQVIDDFIYLCEGNLREVYYIYWLRYRILIKQYELKKDTTHLRLAIEAIDACNASLIKSYQIDKSFHFADLIRDNYISKMHCINLLKNKGSDMQSSALDQMLVETATQAKVTANLLLQSSKLNNRSGASDFKRIMLEIESEERIVNNYKSFNQALAPHYKRLFELYQQLEELPINKNSNHQPLHFEMSQISQILKDQKAMFIDFVDGGDYFYKLSITDSTVRLDTLKNMAVEPIIKSILHKINRPSGVKEDSLIQLVDALNCKLLADDDYTQFDKLFISTDGILDGFPFELLVDRSSGPNVSVSYWASILKLSKINNKPSSSTYFYSFSDKNTTSKKLGNSLTSKELYSAEKEMAEIVKQRPLDRKVTGQKFKKHELLGSDMTDKQLHIISHALSSSSNLLDNYIVLRKNEMDYDYLYGFEIKHHDFSKSDIVLSACETGVGAGLYGVGTYSLSRDFLSAGANSVVSSLWKINDQSTAQLMSYYYTYLASYPSYKALALAKKDLSKDPRFAHPYYWAGFVIEY